MSTATATQDWGDSPPPSPRSPSESGSNASTTPKIRHQETVDPRVVPNIIGRGHVGLKEIGAAVLEATGDSVFIKYIIYDGMAWGFFGVNSHSRDAIKCACDLIHAAEAKFVLAISTGDLRPRIPERHSGRRDDRGYDRDRRDGYDRDRWEDRGGGMGGGKGGYRGGGKGGGKGGDKGGGKGGGRGGRRD